MNLRIIQNKIQISDFLSTTEKRLMQEEHFLRNLTNQIQKLSEENLLKAKKKFERILQQLTKRYRKMVEYKVKATEKTSKLFNKMLTHMIRDDFRIFDSNLEKARIKRKIRKERGKSD